MKQIKRQKNWTTGAMEHDMYFDNRYIGTRATHAQAERDLDAFVFEALTHGETRTAHPLDFDEAAIEAYYTKRDELSALVHAQPSEARS